MRTMRNWMLGMTLVAGLFGVGAATANAAPQVYPSGYGYGREYVPACPGEGYIWVAGYYDGGYWRPGAWVFRGRPGWDRDRGYAYGYGGYGVDRRFHNEHERDFRFRDNRGYENRGNGFDRGHDRDHDRGYDRGHEGRR